MTYDAVMGVPAQPYLFETRELLTRISRECLQRLQHSTCRIS
jgi:CheY-like chemotaxis protein